MLPYNNTIPWTTAVFICLQPDLIAHSFFFNSLFGNYLLTTLPTVHIWETITLLLNLLQILWLVDAPEFQKTKTLFGLICSTHSKANKMAYANQQCTHGYLNSVTKNCSCTTCIICVYLHINSLTKSALLFRTLIWSNLPTKFLVNTQGPSQSKQNGIQINSVHMI